MGILNYFKTKRSLEDSKVLKGKTDRHSHILYGVDDGVRTLEESLSILRYEEYLGVTDVWCTPHIMEDIPNKTEALRTRFNELCNKYEGPLKLHLAAEYMLDTLFNERLRNDDLLVMEDDTLLVETSTIVPPYNLIGMLNDAMSKGYTPLFAHPERCRFLEVKHIENLHSMGVSFQLNIASLTGYYGNTAKVKAETILKKGIYSALGSDCHRGEIIRSQYTRPELTKEIQQLIILL